MVAWIACSTSDKTACDCDTYTEWLPLVSTTVASARFGEVRARVPLLSWPARTPPTLVGTRLYLCDWKEVVAVELGE